MSWATPWMLWGLLALPVLAILQLRHYRPVVRVTGAFGVWLRVVAASGAPPSRWRRWLRGLWRPLTIAGLLVVAAAGPRLDAGARVRRCVLLDPSPSAAAELPGGSSRWEAMTSRALALVRELAAEGHATVLVPPAGVYAGPPAQVIEWIEGLALAVGAVDTTGAETLLLSRARAGEDCWFLSDREPALAGALVEAGVGMEIFASEAPGAGVVGFGVEEVAGAAWVAGEVLVCGESEPELSLVVDRNEVTVGEVHREGDRRRFQIALGSGPPTVAHLRVRVPGDGFASDDEVEWRPPVLALAGEDVEPALAAALGACGWVITEDVERAGAYVGSGPVPPGRAAILLLPVTPGAAVASAGAPELDRDAPAALRETLGRMRLPAVRVVPPPPGARTLVSVGGRPLVVHDESIGTVTLLFDPAETPALVRDPAGAFPILVSWLAGLVAPEPAGTTGLLDPEISHRATHGSSRAVPSRPHSPAEGRTDLMLYVVAAALLLTLVWPARK